MQLEKLTIKQAREMLDKKEISSVDLVTTYLNRAKEKNPELNAFREIFDDAIEQAKIADQKIQVGESAPLLGVPIAIKDNILFKGKIAGASSKILENYKATYSATVIHKLESAGAVIIGRTNMDEFAMGGSSENSAYGPSKNPHDTNRVAGGSSGGSATAVSADMAIASLGSDTGGSIREPASFCGIVGLKPTYGSVSRHGLIAMASSLDVIGPMTKTVDDAEILFDVIKGKDVMDSTSLEGENNQPVKKIGVPRDFLKGVDPDILENFEKSLEKLKGLGYEIVDVKMPALDYSLAVYYVLMPAEVSSNMARYDGVKYGQNIEGENLINGYFKTRGHLIGSEVKRRIMLGTYVLSAGYADEYYNKAWSVRNLIKKEFEKAFENVQIVALPTSPIPAFKIGEKVDDPLSMYLADIFTVSANLGGVPAISVPDGVVVRDEKELPTGLQLIAPWLGEKMLFQVAKKI